MAAPRLTQEERAERAAKIVQMRRGKVQFDAIGREFNISEQRAWQIYQKALADRPNMQVDEHRAEEVELIDTAYRNLMKLALAPNSSDRIRVDAWNAARGWAEHKARLLGLNAPTRHEVSTIDQLDRELADLNAQLGQFDAPAPGQASADSR